MRVTLVVAAAENGVIGREGQLPWRLPADLARFKRLTLGKTVVMGRRTFESVGKPLPRRRNLVLTRDPAWTAPGVEVAAGLEEALARCRPDEEVCLVGGSAVYREGMARARRVHLTRVHARPEGDATFPDELLASWRVAAEERHEPDERHEHAYSFQVWEPAAVQIVDPEPALWPAEQGAAGAALRAALGERALSIHFIGSTAVPGLPAKDRIDVQVGVAALDDPELGAGLARGGFGLLERIDHDHLPPGARQPGQWAKRLAKGPSELGPLNVHLRVLGAENFRYALRFRDYLRAHPAVAAAYAAVKRALAAECGADRARYCELKDPTCDVIAAAAASWAPDWQAPPSEA